VLNILLCLILTQKVAAVAIATAASQVLAATLTVLRLRKLEGNARLCIRKMRFDLHAFTQLMRFGVPLALQTLVYPLANIQIAAGINSYGVACVAGNSAANTMHQITASFRMAFGTAIATFMGQNLGAERPERVRASFFHCVWMCIVLCMPLSLLEWFLGPVWLPIFLGQDAVATSYAMIRVAIMNAFVIFLLMNTLLGHAIQALGYPVFSTVNAAAWVLGFRLFWMSVIYPMYSSYASLIYCFGVSYVLTFICNVVIFTVLYIRYRKGKYKRI
jgi:Na+-driven multidrug efflux pump